MKDVDSCRSKIIKHIKKEFIERGVSPLDDMYDAGNKSDTGDKSSVVDDIGLRALDLVCEHDLGRLCCKYLDIAIQKRSELGRALTGEDLDAIIDDITKNTDVEEQIKIMKFKDYLQNIGYNKKSDKKPMYPDSEAADEALAH